MLARVRGHQSAALIHLAARWSIPDRVGDGITVDALADKLAVDTGALRRMLRALASFEIFSIDDAGCIRQTAASRCLMRDAPRSLHAAALFWGMPAAWTAWGELEYSIRTGESSFEHLFQRSLFDYLGAHTEYGLAFDSFMALSPEQRHDTIVKSYDFSRFNCIADVGGGNGRFIATILRATPTARGIVYDRPGVVEGASHEINALGVGERCTIVPGDFFVNVPGGADAYILSQIIHDWEDEAALRILRNCRQAAGKKSVLLLIERIFDLDADKISPNSYLSDIEMLVLHKAAERSTGEYKELLRESGFQLQTVISTASPFSIIEAAPIG